MKRLVLAAIVAALCLVASGCGTTGEDRSLKLWPSMGWSTNEPSLDPVTNTVPTPIYK